MMANVELTCSVCSANNMVQRVHANMLVKSEMRTFCSTCGIVTSQTISGGSAPPVAQVTPIRSNSPTRTISSNVPMRDDEIWRLLETQLRSNGLLMDDVTRRDDETRGRLFGSLGFGDQEEKRLVDIARKKFNPSPSASSATNYGSNTSRSSPSSASAAAAAASGSSSSSQPPVASPVPSNPTEPRQTAVPSRPTSHPGPAPGSSSYQPTTLPSSQAGGGSNTTPSYSRSGVNATPPNVSSSSGNTPPPQPTSSYSRPGSSSAASPYNTSSAGNASTSSAGSGGSGNIASAVPGSNPQAAARLKQLSSGSSAVQGLTMGEDGTLVARCSVHPHLPAEFWCCACSVLVSSRCHVQGIHKDHPFVPLRLAAESHVRDLCAWNDRCRAQLNVVDTIANNLKHCEEEMNHNCQRELQAVDEAAQQVAVELERWKDQLKKDVQIQVNAQMGGLSFARERTHELREHYGTYLSLTEPLMNSIPPVNAEDREAEHWALRVLDAVTKMKHVTAEAIPVPKLNIPQIQCNASPSMFQELIKCASIPLQMKLPDLIDPGYFNYPHPSSSAKQAFTLVAQGDPAAKGLVITNGRTLSRTQDVLPSHCLVMGSQVFYSGNHSWEVHVDRIGSGGGRILAGIVVNGSDGEGVVWDGTRIVGPNEGEVRNLDDKINWQTGSILRFYLELEGQTGFLSCFFNNEGVARIPLPASGSGWTPAFSVFGPQDQVTIAPSTTSSGGPGVAVAGDARQERRPPAAAAGDTMSVLEQQGSMLTALHQQISHINFKLEQQTLKSAHPGGTEASSQGGTMSQMEGLYPQQGGQQQQHNQSDNSMMMNPQQQQQQQGNFSAASPNPNRPGMMFNSPNQQQQQQQHQQGNTSFDANATVMPQQQNQPHNASAYQQQQQQPPLGPSSGGYNNPAAQRNAPPQAAPHRPVGTAQQGAANVFSGTDTYSPELRQIMKYVDTVHG